MKKICIDARLINSSGIGTYLKNILPFIIKEFPTTLILKKQDFEIFPWMDKSSIIKCNQPIYSIQEHFFFSKIPKFDLFWSPHFDVPFFPIKTKKRVVTIHDVFHLAFFSKLSWKEKIYAKVIYNKAVKKSDAIITDSKFSKEEILKYLKVHSKKINVVSCAANLRHFQKNIVESQEILKKYNLKRPFFLFVGNLKPHKNLKVLIEAQNFLKEEFDLVVIGKSKGLINADLIQLNHKLKTVVHILKDVSDAELPAFYQSAIAFVLPSLYEGFGLPILESMAMSCPVIGSNLASIPEVGGEAMLYFDPKNPFELAKQMRKMSSNHDLRKKLIDAGHNRVKDFSWEASAKKHIELFEELLS